MRPSQQALKLFLIGLTTLSLFGCVATPFLQDFRTLRLGMDRADVLDEDPAVQEDDRCRTRKH